LREPAAVGEVPTLPDVPVGFRETQERSMLKWALIFFVVSLVAGALGFTNVSSATAGVAKILFGIALIIFLVFLVLALLAGEVIF